MRDSDLIPSIVPKDDDRALNPTPSPKQLDLHAAMAMAARLEQANARAHQLARERGRVDDAAQHPSDDRQTPVVTIQPATPGDRPSRGRPALRLFFFFGFLLAACIGVAAIAWQTSYGDAVKQMIGQWASRPVPTSSPSLELQPSPPTVQADAAKVAP